MPFFLKVTFCFAAALVSVFIPVLHFILVPGFLLLGFYFILAEVFRKTSIDGVCKDCGFHGNIPTRRQGSLGIELVLWFFFLVPGLIYTLWRSSRRACVCPSCGGAAVIPINSPIGEKLARTP